MEKPALLIIDMVKDNFNEKHHFPITPLARKTIAPINRLIGLFRKKAWPIVFSTDSFRAEDFIFQGRMKPHSLEGTEGAAVIDELDRTEEDLWLPKRRFSAFFKTDLEGWLRQRGVTLCAVSGITTNFCVLTTAMDAVCCDFKTVILEDCTAAVTEEIHQRTLDLYRRTAVYPLLRVLGSGPLISELQEQEGK